MKAVGKFKQTVLLEYFPFLFLFCIQEQVDKTAQVKFDAIEFLSGANKVDESHIHE